MKTNLEKFKKYELEKSKMAKIKGGGHYEIINGKLVLVAD
jgi:natural product precursor